MKHYGYETIVSLEKEIKRLKKENATLMLTLDAVKQYKDDYEILIQEVKEIKKKYTTKLANIDRILKNYEMYVKNTRDFSHGMN